MAGERHHGVRVHSGLDQMADSATAEVVDDTVFEADGLARRLPDRAKISDRSAMLMEDVRANRAGAL